MAPLSGPKPLLRAVSLSSACSALTSEPRLTWIRWYAAWHHASGHWLVLSTAPRPLRHNVWILWPAGGVGVLPRLLQLSCSDVYISARILFSTHVFLAAWTVAHLKTSF
ncbi:hypothetical protein METBIDRAFT_137672 [Metschnikowia bicuspidata var. bicuspidata NRRL YB-4993]|uniref:Uncharacterized protein n=1 Tax=Metschnikowia bicuspidata var. bicuspidata NRRL YB-4993 TaxID=869754 RepID=A0A1A0GWJ5_9ASCO|nr:hypothetical protein METBIDRAFT_137672 [Metschnikowia bicuspidata var. bicuspidata NRRL YB-4993]OBA16129.1 hypothetical protein METBIDRAFT_137672 [Metschnikowia bicuspidata var. bicuspidata NRRL YB-4993]